MKLKLQPITHIETSMNKNRKSLKLVKSDSSLSHKENKKVYEMAVRSILKTLDLKDNYTYGHSLRVAQNCLILADHMNMNDEQMYDLELSALFHDIGKIGIPDRVLSKPHRLTDDEFEVMKRHPEMSYEILKDFEGFEQIALNARHHHERFDGRGYPDKLAGNKIPLFSRIILLADTFDAITSSRVYREGMSVDIAYSEILENAGTQFDPLLAKAFVKAMKRRLQSKEDKTFITLIDDFKEFEYKIGDDEEAA